MTKAEGKIREEDEKKLTMYCKRCGKQQLSSRIIRKLGRTVSAFEALEDRIGAKKQWEKEK